MKILWFTDKPLNVSMEYGYCFFGGGWISSLETLVADTKNYELGICFLYDGNNYEKINKGNVIYYRVPLKKGNAFKRIIRRHWHKLNDESPYYFDAIIDDFKPDLIHVFGTENGYGKILMNKSEKVLFHLQGLVAPIADVFLPPGFNTFKILSNSNLNSIFRGITIFHDLVLFKKVSKREQIIVKHWKYFSGRTEWDRNYIRLINPDANYFHCDELLRKEFYQNEWIQPSRVDCNEEIIIGSTMNPFLYKGLDLVYKVMNLVDRRNIHWKIFGIGAEDNVIKTILGVLKIKNIPQNIKFYGQINADELIKQLKTCHFYTHPSYIDNSPNSVCEAMILGMPVLSSSVGGIRSLIADRETGFLFNPYDKYDLVGLLTQLINNYELAKQAGIKARQIALRRHSPDSIISELNNIYSFIYNDNS